MHNFKVVSGGTIYREGDDSDAVYIISSGRIEVSRRSGQEDVVLAVLEDGQIFGEMGILQGKPRSTTTRALSDVVLMRLTEPEFMKAFGGADSVALKILRMLCERLRRVDGQIIDHYNREMATLMNVSRIVLLPDSAEMELQVGAQGIAIEKLPFKVGRCARIDTKPKTTANSLRVRPNEMFQIDSDHFVIEKQDGQIFVRDLASHLGTYVNGRRIASFEYSNSAELAFGMNDIIAGGIDSPYRFRIVLERSDTQPGDHGGEGVSVLSAASLGRNIAV